MVKTLSEAMLVTHTHTHKDTSLLRLIDMRTGVILVSTILGVLNQCPVVAIVYSSQVCDCTGVVRVQ